MWWYEWGEGVKFHVMSKNYYDPQMPLEKISLLPDIWQTCPWPPSSSAPKTQFFFFSININIATTHLQVQCTSIIWYKWAGNWQVPHWCIFFNKKMPFYVPLLWTWGAKIRCFAGKIGVFTITRPTLSKTPNCKLVFNTNKFTKQNKNWRSDITN